MSADISASGVPQLLSGRYRLEQLLGAGGMGRVYRARDLLHEQFGDPASYVAIKLLREDVARCPDGLALLYGEFALTRHLRHRHIVQAYHFEVDNRCRLGYFSLQLLHGMPLDRLLCERPQGLPWSELRGIALALLDALAHAHGRGVLHGDLKPGNLMLGDDGLQLFDFGLGQALEGTLSGLPRLSRGRFNAWTPGYTAPELLEGAPLGVHTDLYAAACVIHELAGGRYPRRHLDVQQARLQYPSQLPARLWPALRLALAPAAEARCITLAELRNALAGSLSMLQRWRRGG